MWYKMMNSTNVNTSWKQPSEKGNKIMFAQIIGRRLLCVGTLMATAASRAPAETKKPTPISADLAAIIKPSAAANKWQQIPWLADVTEARKLAKEEKRPLFLWTVFGEPLDEC